MFLRKLHEFRLSLLLFFLFFGSVSLFLLLCLFYLLIIFQLLFIRSFVILFYYFFLHLICGFLIFLLLNLFSKSSSLSRCHILNFLILPLCLCLFLLFCLMVIGYFLSSLVKLLFSLLLVFLILVPTLIFFLFISIVCYSISSTHSVVEGDLREDELIIKSV